jgi:hypothetical protein
MTPKEAAEQIVEKYMPMMYCYLGSGMLTNSYDEGVAKSNAKSCAILHCQGIIDVLGGVGVYSFADPEVEKYWQQVLNEIQSL